MLANWISLYKNELFYALLLLSLVISRLPFVGKITRIVNTMIHESGHAFVALFLRGEVVKIDLFHDTSGRALTKNSGKFSSILISLSGYPFSSLIAFLLFYFFKSQNYIIPLFILATFALINLLFWVRNLYGILWLSLFLILSFILVYYEQNTWIFINSVFWGGILLSDSLISSLVVFYLSVFNAKGSGDANSLKEQTHIPSFFWGFVFAFISAYITYLIFKMGFIF